jgi:hypothetical protein
MKSTQKIIARLASLRAQDRYIVNATKDHYYLPEELIDVAISALQREKDNQQVRILMKHLRSISVPESISSKDLVYSYAPWTELRKLAALYLEEQHFDLAAWEIEEL